MVNQTETVLTWRPLDLVDVPRLSDWLRSSSDTAFFDRSWPLPIGRDGLQRGWQPALEQATNPSSYWYIAETDSQVPVGICGLQDINYVQGDGTLPFFVAEHFRNRGLAKAMAIWMIDLSFRQLRLHRLTTYHRSDNAASEKVLTKLKFHNEGRIREGWNTVDGRKDTVIAGLLNSEWHANRKSILSAAKSSCSLIFTPNCWRS